MSESTMDAAAQAAAAQYRFKLSNNRLGLWLFILSDAFVFAGLLVARFYLLGDSRPHLDQTLGLIVTAVLLVSSFFMNRAETAMAHGDRKGFLRGTLITLILGVIFLVGVVGVEWQIALTTFEAMSLASLAASTITYNAAISACESGDRSGARGAHRPHQARLAAARARGRD